jgi:glycosyltransferase involved in cell wall biosynthesis
MDPPDSSYLSNDPFETVAIGKGKGPWSYNPDLLPWLTAHLADYDAVVVHGLWLYHGFAVNKAIRLLSSSRKPVKVPPYYVMPHGMLDPYFQSARGRKLKAIRNKIYWNLIESRLIQSAEAILFTTESELKLARKTFKPYGPKSELNIGYGVADPPSDEDRLKRSFIQKYPELENRELLLFLSRVHEKKGVDMLLKAYAAVYGGVNLAIRPVLIVAGPGMESKYGQQLKNDTLKLRIEDSVIFAGMLEGDLKWGAFYGCSAFILPTHQENFGIAVAEALSCGCPVLISNQVNIWREIVSKGGGRAENDTYEGTKKLLNFWKDLSQTERISMGESARQCFRESFAVQAAAEKFASALGHKKNGAIRSSSK